MKLFLAIAAVCIAATVATEVSHEDQVRHEEMLAELCKETGIFPNPHDPEGRTFIRCELEPVELRCDDGFIFDAEKLMCVEEPKPEPIPVDMDKVDWMAVLKCPNFEDKYYRNPYDCHRFYRCYQEGHFQRIGLGQCVPSMIFDDVLETCLPADQFKSYYGHGCEARALPDEFKPGHEHKDDENTHPDPEHKDDENTHPDPEHKDDENTHPDPEHKDDENTHPDPEHKDDENTHPDPEHKDDENTHPDPEHKDDENTHPDPEHKDDENSHPDPEHKDDENSHPDPEHKDDENTHPEPDNHEQEKEPEKVPSLKDILKEIQEMFNKKH